MGVGPRVAHRRQPPDHAHGLVSSRRARPWPPGGRDEGGRGPFAKAQWQLTMVLIVRMSERHLLLARRGSVGGVESEAKGGGRLGGAGEAVVHPGPCEPREVLAVPRRLQPGAGGSPREVVLDLQWTPRSPQGAPRVMAALSGVMRRGISRGALRHALGQQVPQGRGKRGLMSCVVDSGSEAFRQAHLAVDTTAQERTKVG